MSIASRLVELRRNLILSQKKGFDPNPAAMPPVNVIANLKDV